MTGFKVNDTEILSAKFQIYSSDTQARKSCLLIYRVMYGNAITKIMYGLVHIIANYSAMKIFKQETK